MKSVDNTQQDIQDFFSQAYKRGLSYRKYHYLVSGQLQKLRDIDTLYTWAGNMVMWYWSAHTLFLTGPEERSPNADPNAIEIG